MHLADLVEFLKSIKPSARQRAIAETMTRLAASDADQGDLVRLQRWTAMVAGRGACHHPDGASGFLRSALSRFGPDFESHQSHRRIGALA